MAHLDTSVPAPADGACRVRTALKRSLLVMLVALNAALVLGLLGAAGLLPQALAQPAGRGGNYLCVTAKSAGQAYDVLYILDQSGQQLHAYYPPQPQSRQLVRAEPRDLKKDFGG